MTPPGVAYAGSPSALRAVAQYAERQADAADGALSAERGLEPDDEAPLARQRPVLDPAAYHGPLGTVVRELELYTEAEPAGVLASLLVGLGACIGRAPYQRLDGARHGVNLFALLVGPSSHGRKGTAVARARMVLDLVEPAFAQQNVRRGLTSGQGIIYHVRDGAPAAALTSREEATGQARGTTGSRRGSREPDTGVADKRLFVLEDEFAGALRQMGGRENTLSPVLREAWDGGTLGTLTRHDALRATDPHVAVLGQITPEELRALVGETDFANGLLNRFLFIYTERARVLPEAPEPDAARFGPAVAALATAVHRARRIGELALDPGAQGWWRAAYEALTSGGHGRAGGATRRGAPYVRRLAALYAVLDGTPTVATVHLDAALAVWRYSAASAHLVFGEPAFSSLADRLLSAIRDAGAAGLPRAALRDGAGSHNVPTAKLRDAIQELLAAGAVTAESEATTGRPREVFHAREHAAAGQNEYGRNGREPVLGSTEAGVPAHSAHIVSVPGAVHRTPTERRVFTFGGDAA